MPLEAGEMREQLRPAFDAAFLEAGVALVADQFQAAPDQIPRRLRRLQAPPARVRVERGCQPRVKAYGQGTGHRDQFSWNP